MAELFEVEVKLPMDFCRTCVHRNPWQCGGAVIQYCGVRKSNLTNNGQLKIKCKTPACLLYKKDK